jgi:hypothetical protein
MRVFLSEVFGRTVNTEHNNRGMPLLCGSGFSEKLNSSNLLSLKCMSHFKVPSMSDSCSFGLSTTSQQYFFLSEQTSISHQPPAKRTDRQLKPDGFWTAHATRLGTVRENEAQKGPAQDY